MQSSSIFQTTSKYGCYTRPCDCQISPAYTHSCSHLHRPAIFATRVVWVVLHRQIASGRTTLEESLRRVVPPRKRTLWGESPHFQFVSTRWC
ncbi:hypothetical protein V2G26_003648 [Clonostachys chloroleuca]